MLATTKQPIGPSSDASISIDKTVGDFVKLSANTADKNRNKTVSTVNMNQQVGHINITTATTSNFNKSINSPDYNYYLNYSTESPMATDSSTTPFSNNETTSANLYTPFLQKAESLITNNNNNNNSDNNNNNNNDSDDSNNKKLDSAAIIQLPVNNQIDDFPGSKDSYVINNPSNRSSPSISSSITKLNTANNSTANLSKLNFRLNYITSTTNSSDKTISHPNNDHNSTSVIENNRTDSSALSTNSNIDGSTLTNDSPINNLSGPSVMNDLLELLDAKETEKQQNNDVLSTTTATIADNNNNTNNNNNISKPFSFLDDSSPLTMQYNTENDFLQLDDVFGNDVLPVNRRTSIVVNNKFPNLTKTRNSISHNVDFWNMNSKKSQEIGPSSMDIDPINTEFSNNILNIDNNNVDNNSNPTQSINNDVTQVLSGYNMDFSKDISKSNSTIHNTSTNTTRNNDSNATSTDFNNFLYSPKQNITHQQRTSVPLISESLYGSLYGNSTINNNDNDQMLTVDNNNSFGFNPKFGIDDDNIPLPTLNSDDFNITAFKNNLFDNDAINENSSSIINNNVLATPGKPEFDNETFINNNVNEFFNQLNDTSMEKKFIKPSMMLSEKASIAAKLAIKGIPKVETFPTIDTQPYTHPTRITKRKSISSMASNGSSIHKHAYTSTRRKSTVGVVRSSSAMTPNVSISSATNKKNTLTSPTSGPHSTDPENMEEKPFQCAECPKAFKRSEHLKRHIRSVHSNERPFPCTLCDKKFSRSDNLSQHLKTHKKHGDF